MPRAAAQEPDPASLITGKLERYRPGSGACRIAYTPDTMKGDFIRKGERAWIHQAAFTGPFSITMKESDYSRTARNFVLCFKGRESPFYTCSIFVGEEEGRVPQRDAMMRTVRHEGFHQYFDRIVSDPPTWINEGLAEYYEAAEYQNGRWNTGLVRRDLLDHLDRRMPSLAELVNLPPRTFYGRHAPLHYAHAWAFVHFLLHGPKAGRKLFDRLLEGLQSENDRAATGATKILDGGTLQALEPVFRAYLERLRAS